MMRFTKYLPAILFLWSSGMLPGHAQNHTAEIAGYRHKQLHEITVGPEAPLLPADSLSLSYFAVDSSYQVSARVEFLKGEKPFKMATYAGTTKDFVRHARLYFEIEGVKYVLTAYKNLNFPGPLASWNTTLFIPFKDETNGGETYGGGRYLDLPIPKEAKQVMLDFNKAYNPYCAYSDGYQCPVPPAENRLLANIRAGEKDYTGKKRSRGVKFQPD